MRRVLGDVMLNGDFSIEGFGWDQAFPNELWKDRPISCGTSHKQR